MDDEYQRLLAAAVWCGNSSYAGVLLPDDTNGPVDPPAPPQPKSPGKTAYFQLQRELGVLTGNATEAQKNAYNKWWKRHQLP